MMSGSEQEMGRRQLIDEACICARPITTRPGLARQPSVKLSRIVIISVIRSRSRQTTNKRPTLQTPASTSAPFAPSPPRLPPGPPQTQKIWTPSPPATSTSPSSPTATSRSCSNSSSTSRKRPGSKAVCALVPCNSHSHHTNSSPSTPPSENGH